MISSTLLSSRILSLHALLFYLLCSTSVLFAQENFLETIPQSKGSRNYPVVNDDGGWMIAGSVFSATSTRPSEILLQKFDPCGQVIWAKKYFTPDFSLDLIMMIQSSDQFLYLMGYFIDENNNRDIFLCKLNPDGTVVFHYNYGLPGGEFPYSLNETPDGNFMIYFNQNTGGGISRNALLLLDSDGNIVFKKSFFDIGIWGRGLACKDGGFLCHSSRIIYKVDAAGSVEWSNRYSDLSHSSPPIEVDGGFVEAVFKQVNSDTSFFLYKLDEAGQIVWQTPTMLGRGAPEIRLMDNGNILCLNPTITEQDSTNRFLALHLFSSEGELLQQSALLEWEGNSNLFSTNLAILPDGKVLICGFDDADNESLLVGKTNIDLELGCNDFDFSYTGQIVPIEITPFSINPQSIEMPRTEQPLLITEESANPEHICFTPDWVFPNLPPDTTLCTGDTLRLDVSLEQTTYLWQDGSTAATFTVQEAGTYNVVLERCGILEARSIEVNIEDCPCQVIAPNAFTPDGDGLNDSFEVLSDCPFQSFEIQIFNRWGKLVYQSRNPDQGWNGFYVGKVAPMDVYLFQYTYQLDRNGQNEVKTISGSLTLIR